MAYFHCLIGGGSSGGGYELTVTCDADFAGTTITCTDGVTTLTQTCPSASPYEVVFAIPNGGEWTVSGVIGSASYSASVDIPDSLELHLVPEGSTVLPTDDIQIWLKCAGITDKSYTTLNEVLADLTTLLALMSNNNAVDYLVRSTTWASGITTDSTAMTDIGANNYCANTLLSDSTWAEAICNSTYFESVLNVKVPVMTSNTTPSGETFSDKIYTGYDAYKGFDNNVNTECASETKNVPWSVGYRFTSSVCIKSFKVIHRSGTNYATRYILQGSNDYSYWQDIGSEFTNDTAGATQIFVVSNNTSYLYYKIKILANGGSGNGFKEVQFYGREDV